MKDNHRLNALSVAFMYLGTIMGAGFASGREIWQFFGVFGERSYFGVALVGLLFVIIGVMTGVVARKIGSNDMGRVIVPGSNRVAIECVGYFMAFILFTVIIAMSAAGGALFAQQFGQSRILGGVVIVFLVVATVIGGFERISKVFRWIVPLLVIIIIIVCFAVLVADIPPRESGEVIKPSPLANHWLLAVVLYLSYNVLAVIPIVATAAYNAKNTYHALGGAALGGIFLLTLAFILVTTLNSDPNLSQTADMPMLAFSAKLNPWVNWVYTGVMLFAIYASATGNYYGFTLKIKPSPRRKIKIVVIAWIGFAFGLMGFKNVVAYMLPIEGFAGIAIILMLAVNFVMVLTTKKKSWEEPSMFSDFEGHDRFNLPNEIMRVTAGFGGEAFLILGSQKTALYDCGMAYCGPELIDNIIKALEDNPLDTREERKLDYVILSHTHYDHLGALPFVRTAFPEVKVYGAAHGKNVLDRPGARKMISSLGASAAKAYSKGRVREVPTDGLKIDRILSDGEILSLGKEQIIAMETKGHTDCSMSYIVEPAGILIAGESTGVLEGEGIMHTAILKSYEDSMRSLEKCRNCGAKTIISPHYGVVPQYYNEKYWELFQFAAKEEKEFVGKMWKEDMVMEEMLERFKDRYWEEERARDQPLPAFMVNAKCTIMMYKPDK